MRLLVTRPIDQATRTAQKLEAQGHQPVLAPALEIAPTGASLPKGAFDLVLATSAQALACIESIHALVALPLACVGEKTADAARAAGFSLLHVAPQVEALVDRLLAESGTKSAIYLAGRERKTCLEESLRSAGWTVEIVETYAAQPVASWPEKIRAALDAGDIDGVLHFSPRSAALSLALIGRAPARRLRHFCLSPAIAVVCGDWAPPENIFTASQPDEEALITLLRARDAPGDEMG